MKDFCAEGWELCHNKELFALDIHYDRTLRIGPLKLNIASSFNNKTKSIKIVQVFLRKNAMGVEIFANLFWWSLAEKKPLSPGGFPGFFLDVPIDLQIGKQTHI